MTRTAYLIPLLLALLTAVSGCRTVYYSTMEKFGYEKRDLLKKSVSSARNEQEKAQEQFQDALTRMKEMYAFDGGNLEKSYNKLKSDHEACETRAKAVSKRIQEMERVAADMFTEWESEIAQFTNPTFASDSRSKLISTRSRFDQLARTLRQAEGAMQPVLQSLGEQTLYLKHNLNAAAINSLRGEVTNIQVQIDALVRDLQASIAEADAFIKTLN